MNKQNICIIGGGITGLITAISLSKLSFNIDLVSNKKKSQLHKTIRTSAISQNNYDFLKKLNIFKFSKKNFWPCSEIKLYAKTKKEKITEILNWNKNKNSQEKVFYMVNNNNLFKECLKYIKKNKLIKFKINKSNFLKHIKMRENSNSKYNLHINCSGNNSNLSKTINGSEYFKYSYKEIAVSTTIRHNFVVNNIARQIFLEDEILALLPISNTKTSIVFTAKKKNIQKYKNFNNLLIKKIIEENTTRFYKKVKFVTSMEFKDVNLFFPKKAFHERMIILGDALHEVHPFAGQGFNMTLRDLSNLQMILKEKINLGLDIGSSDILSEFSNNIKSKNFLYLLGIDFIRKSFSFKKKPINFFRNSTISMMNKNTTAKNIFFNLADKGLNL